MWDLTIDTTFTEKGLDYKDFPAIYVIFISKFDVFQENKTIYHNSTGQNSKFPKQSKEGADAMTQIVEEYANKKVLERDKETAKSLLQNGVPADVVIKSILTISMEFIEKLHRQLATVEKQ